PVPAPAGLLSTAGHHPNAASPPFKDPATASIARGRTHARTRVLMLVQTWTSASSTPPPANYVASSPLTPTAITSPPDGHPDPRPRTPRKTRNPEPYHGFGMSSMS